MPTITTTVGLGDEVKERLTGVTGIAVAISLFRTGCNHIAVKREGVDANGKPWELIWFDEPELEITHRGKMPSQFQQLATVEPREPRRELVASAPGGPSLIGAPPEPARG